MEVQRKQLKYGFMIFTVFLILRSIVEIGSGYWYLVICLKAWRWALINTLTLFWDYLLILTIIYMHRSTKEDPANTKFLRDSMIDETMELEKEQLAEDGLSEGTNEEYEP